MKKRRAIRRGRCRWVRDDGGRYRAGYRNNRVSGGCVPRAIAIATGKPYREVHKALVAATLHYVKTHRTYLARWIRRSRDGRGFDPEYGSYQVIYGPYLESIGWRFTPTKNQKVRLRADELPSGRLIVRVHRHLVAVIDGVIRDTFNSGQAGRRPVTGYYTKA